MTKYEAVVYPHTFVNSISPISHQNIVIYLSLHYLVRKREEDGEGGREEGREGGREGRRDY